MPSGFVTPFPGSAPYTSPNTIPIAQMIQRSGEDAANARLRSGDISANLWSNLGTTIAHIPAEIAQAKAQSQEAQARQMEIDAAKANQAGLSNANQIVSALMTTNPDGSRTVDRTKAQAAMAHANVPLTVQQSVFKALDDTDASIQKFTQAKTDHRADLAHSAITMIDAGLDPHLAVTTAARLAHDNGLTTDAEIGQFMSSLSTIDPTNIRNVLGGVRATSEKYKDIEKPIVVPKDATLATPQGKTIATGAAGAPTAEETDIAGYIGSLKLPAGTTWDALTPDQKAGFKGWQQSQGPVSMEQKPVLLDGKSDLVDYNPRTGKSFKSGVDVSDRVKPIPSAAQVSINAGDLSATALDQAAQKYLDTGILPPGYGAAGTLQKTKIMNRAAELDPKAALGRNQAIFKADSANLTKLQTTEGALSAFENAAGKNIKQFTDLAAKLPDSGVPWLNTPLRQLDDKLVGAEWLPAVQAARKIALREVARVTNDPGLRGQLSDAARTEVNDMADGNATIAQMKRVFPVLLQDMANVHSGLTDEITEVKGRLGGNPAAATASPKEGDTKPIDGYPGTEQTFRGGKWIRTK